MKCPPSLSVQCLEAAVSGTQLNTALSLEVLYAGGINAYKDM